MISQTTRSTIGTASRDAGLARDAALVPLAARGASHPSSWGQFEIANTSHILVWGRLMALAQAVQYKEALSDSRS